MQVSGTGGAVLACGLPPLPPHGHAGQRRILIQIKTQTQTKIQIQIQCRSPLCSSLVFRSGITYSATEKKSNHIVKDNFVILITAIFGKGIIVLSKMKSQKRKSKFCQR